MITLIISAAAVGILALLFRGLGKLRRMEQEEKLKQKALKAHLPDILGLEAMGFTAEALDEDTEKYLEKGRANRDALLPDYAKPCTIGESIAACYLDPNELESAKNAIAGIEKYCNLKFHPDIGIEVSRFARGMSAQEAEEKARAILERGKA